VARKEVVSRKVKIVLGGAVLATALFVVAAPAPGGVLPAAGQDYIGIVTE